ncbi:gamma-glutamylcyclotransferase [Pseudohaliea rubra]|uniref:glutathione-specific gamma-glutamylcyclotransferase n=1 Tax=Pseudohaliea rubra DSM 19751 TaxID=1265313 RepID=A0A095VNU0_9GAMM|nr:gamma-glutamylcyclotransferase [Pseudohaliea rubra]KGE02783.1 Cation transport protein chaC [Pseudohaliea rubra DSM 19751]
MSQEPAWVFGYGSLIYKVDFPFLDRRNARIDGWERRFWQGSHDHRGTPEAPGRVVTLIKAPGVRCRGVAYLVEPEVFDHLDYREKNGYARHRVPIVLDDRAAPVVGFLYVATEDNPAFLGPAPLEELAAHIAGAAGPSGSNGDYLLQLAEALHALESYDDHVHPLAERVDALRALRQGK